MKMLFPAPDCNIPKRFAGVVHVLEDGWHALSGCGIPAQLVKEFSLTGHSF